MSTPLLPRARQRLQTRLRQLIQDREHGAYALQLAVMAVAILAVAMFAIDQGSKIRAARTATTSAQEAARSAAQQLQPGIVQGDPARIDPTKAAGAARAYLRAAGVTGTVQVNGSRITVTTSAPWNPTVLQLVGVGATTLTGTATARIDQP